MITINLKHGNATLEPGPNSHPWIDTHLRHHLIFVYWLVLSYLYSPRLYVLLCTC